MPPQDFSLTVPIRSRDIDMLGHLNQAVYHELLEDARMGLVVGALGDEVAMAWVLVRSELNYRREVRRAVGSVDAVARVAALGTRSLTLEQEVRFPDGTIAAEGTAVIVAWDGEARRSREISDHERETLQAWLA